MVEYIERRIFFEADELVKDAACNMSLSANVFFQVVPYVLTKTVESETRLTNLIEGEVWRAPIMAYLRHYYKPDNNTDHIRMQWGAKAY
jgi:hypothetical protein